MLTCSSTPLTIVRVSALAFLWAVESVAYMVKRSTRPPKPSNTWTAPESQAVSRSPFTMISSVTVWPRFICSTCSDVNSASSDIVLRSLRPIRSIS